MDGTNSFRQCMNICDPQETSYHSICDRVWDKNSSLHPHVDNKLQASCMWNGALVKKVCWCCILQMDTLGCELE